MNMRKKSDKTRYYPVPQISTSALAVTKEVVSTYAKTLKAESNVDVNQALSSHLMDNDVWVSFLHFTLEDGNSVLLC